MAVLDLWHKRDGAPCPACRLKNCGSPAARHGRGLRWRTEVGDHPTRSFAVKADAETWETHLKTRPAVSGAQTVAGLVDLWLAGKEGLSQGGYDQCRRAADRVKAEWGLASPTCAPASPNR